MIFFTGIFSKKAFIENNPEILEGIVENYTGGHGEIYRLKSREEAEVAFRQIFLWRQIQLNPRNCCRDFCFLKNNFCVELPPDLQLMALDASRQFMTNPTKSNQIPSRIWEGTPYSTNFLAFRQPSAFWACVGNNSYGIVNNEKDLLNFLLHDKILYPAVYAFPTEEIARYFAKNYYLARYQTIFLGHLPAMPIDYEVNQFYLDPRYDEYLKQENSCSAWVELLKNGIFQGYFGG